MENQGENNWCFTRRYGEYRPEHRQDVIGKSLFEIVPQGHPVSQQILQGIQSKQYFTFMDGTTPGKIYQTRCKPMLDEEGNVCRLVGVSIDITESLASQITVLDEANRMTSELQTSIDSAAQEIIDRPDFYDHFFMVYQPIVNFKQEPKDPNRIFL